MEKMVDYILGLLFTLWAFFLPVNPLIALVGAFILADTLMGLYTAVRMKRQIKSRKMARFAIKLAIYTGVMFLVYGLDMLILTDVFNLDSSKYLPSKFIAGALCFVEGLSINEHLEELTGGRGVPYYWRKLIDFIKGVKGDINSFENPDKK